MWELKEALHVKVPAYLFVSVEKNPQQNDIQNSNLCIRSLTDRVQHLGQQITSEI